MNKKGLLISILIIAIAGIGIWVNFGFVDKNNVKDVAEIQNVINKGVNRFQNISVLPGGNSSSLNKIPEDVKQKQIEKFSTELSEYYSGPLLATRIDQCKGGLEFQENNKFRLKDGGVKKIENFTATVDGDTAKAEADLTKWVTMMNEFGKDSTSEITSHYKFTLNKIDGKWKITGEEFEHLPGQGV